MALALALEPLFHVSQNGYLAALVATFAGVMGGIPLALLLDRFRQSQEEKARTTEAERALADAREAERKRVSGVLGLIRGELTDDEAMLEVRTNTPWEVRPPFLGSGVWHALNNSGATVGIAAELIEQMARAY